VRDSYLGRWYAKDSKRYYVDIDKKLSAQKYKMYIMEVDAKNNKIVYDSFFLNGEEIKQTKINQTAKFTDFAIEIQHGHLVREL
jgi:hypothetical protein